MQSKPANHKHIQLFLGSYNGQTINAFIHAHSRAHCMCMWQPSPQAMPVSIAEVAQGAYGRHRQFSGTRLPMGFAAMVVPF